MSASPDRGFAGAVTGRRTAWLFALLPLLAAIALMVSLGEGERTPLTTDQLPVGYDSTAGTALLDQLPDETTTTAIVLFTADQGKLTPDALGALQTAAGELGAAGGRVLPSQDGTAALAVVSVPEGSAVEVGERVKELRASADELSPSGVSAQVTGPAAVKADLAAVFEGADVNLLMATALVVAVLLVVTYRSPVLWVIPLLVVGVADRFAAVAATQVMAGIGMAWDESTTGILSVLVFGAGTDYALLLISRYRDELHREESRHVAMARALRRTGEAVLASAVTVVLGLLTLLLSAFPSTRGLGFACAIGIVIAATFALIVLPAVLVLFGRWVFWPRVPRFDGQQPGEGRTVFDRIGNRVARSPGTVITASMLLLVVLASGIGWIKLGLDNADQFLDTPEAISAAERLGESFPAGIANPLQVSTTDDGDAVLKTVSGTPGVESAEVAQSGNGVTVINTVLDGTSSNADAIEGLRAALAPYQDTYVTGSAAQALDQRAAQNRDLAIIVPLILVLVLGSLLVLLRSVVAPVLLVVTVVGTYVAALGASWWLFTSVLGMEAMDSGVPLLAFLFLVALGVDYNIFLVTRAREETPAAGTRGGMLKALSATGGVITSAGILLAAVFAVLGVLPLVVLAQLGTVICIGVLLDTLVVRTLLVPALAIKLDDRFWWPRVPGARRGVAASR